MWVRRGRNTTYVGHDSKRIGWGFLYFFHLRVARSNAEFAVVDKEFFLFIVGVRGAVEDRTVVTELIRLSKRGIDKTVIGGGVYATRTHSLIYIYTNVCDSSVGRRNTSPYKDGLPAVCVRRACRVYAERMVLSATTIEKISNGCMYM